MTVLLIEQNARQALMVADYAYILESGKIVADDKASVLLESPDLVNSYLGT